jgi:hypothetical protein
MNSPDSCTHVSSGAPEIEPSDLYCQGLLARLWGTQRVSQIYRRMTGLQKVLLWKWAQDGAQRAGFQ